MGDEKIAPEYLRGFNDSYLIAEHLPELSEKLSKVEGDSLRLQGMRDGRQQYLSDKVKTKLPSWLKTQKGGKDTSLTEKFKTRGIEPPSK